MNAICFGFLFVFSCSSPQPVAADSFCRVAKILTVSRADTAETKRQAREHNAKVRRLCQAAKR